MPLTNEQQATLANWADIAKERAVIEEFLDWLEEKGIGTFRLSMSRSDAMDLFYGIDRRKLENARRILLQDARDEQRTNVS